MYNIIYKGGNFLSIHYEIERKFLIRMPKVEDLAKNKECKSVNIMQTYLKDKTRIRKCETENETVYIKTVKHKISDVTRIEEESLITKEEYLELFNNKDPMRQTIQKVRYKYPYKEKVFEIDIFPFWDDRAFLEIELEREEEEFSIPPILEVIKEVTHQKEYRNFALSKEIPTEEI